MLIPEVECKNETAMAVRVPRTWPTNFCSQENLHTEIDFGAAVGKELL